MGSSLTLTVSGHDPHDNMVSLTAARDSVGGIDGCAVPPGGSFVPDGLFSTLMPPSARVLDGGRLRIWERAVCPREFIWG